MLEYDNTAFHYFLLSILTFYLVPSYFNLLSTLFFAFFPSASSDEGRTSQEKKKNASVKKSQKGFASLGRPFLVHLSVTFVLTLLFLYTAYHLSLQSSIATFDPYTILDLDHNADKTQIKKAYRAKSLRYHPDKNPDNPSAEAMFMMIAKAYEALTDEKSKENWEKYGNPDGKQSLEVSIGLPTFLLDNDNRQYILVFYLVMMVVVIPFGVWSYYNNSSQYGEYGVLYKTWSWLHSSMRDAVVLKFLPEILAGCAEFHQIMPEVSFFFFLHETCDAVKYWDDGGNGTGTRTGTGTGGTGAWTFLANGDVDGGTLIWTGCV